MVGDLDPSRTFIHVLDDDSLITLMKNRDTVTDFVLYLEKKEKLLRESPYKIIAPGEEELLAIYLSNMNKEGEHDFVFPLGVADKKPNAIALTDGYWGEFEDSEQRKAQKRQDKISYMWDSFIERFNEHALAGTQYHVSAGGIKDSEKAVHFMAAVPRFERRLLSLSLKEMLEITTPTQRRIRVQKPRIPTDPYFVLLLFPKPKKSISEEEYRRVRGRYLEAVCMVTKLKFPEARHIVGFSTESGLAEMRSEDAMYLDVSKWNAELENEAKRLQKEAKILISPQESYVHAEEYPNKNKKAEPGRNDPCPCGSGKKFKGCCLNRKRVYW